MADIGWARVSTGGQSLDSQIDDLKNLGCKKIFFSKESGAKEEIAELNNAINYMREGDFLVMTKLSRLHRSMLKGIRILYQFKEKGFHIKTLKDGVDTSTPAGELVYIVMSWLAEWDRQNIIDNTRAGLKSARARGRVGGRRRFLNREQVEKLVKMHNDPKQEIPVILKYFGISQRTLNDYAKGFREGVLWFQDGYEEFKRARRQRKDIV